jgi:hypothetical protein
MRTTAGATMASATEIILDDEETYIERRPVTGGGMSLLADLFVERGTLEDWKTLHELHYKSSNLGIGPRYMRCGLSDGSERGQTIGVMVFTVPKPLDSGRNLIFKHLRPNSGGKDTRIINVSRMKWLNQNLILSSRTVIDTMYRGAGIAYRFKNIGYRMMGYRYIESRSSMSRYNPFSLKAGMRFVKPKSAAAFETGLAFFAKWFKSPAYDYVAIKDEILGMSDWMREATLKALREFYYRHSSMEKSGDNRLNGTSRVESMELGYLLKQTQQLVFGATVYAIWKNPDFDETTMKMRQLPARIPLSAFDNQGLDEPLRLDLLNKELK